MFNFNNFTCQKYKVRLISDSLETFFDMKNKKKNDEKTVLKLSHRSVSLQSFFETWDILARVFPKKTGYSRRVRTASSPREAHRNPERLYRHDSERSTCTIPCSSLLCNCLLRNDCITT